MPARGQTGKPSALIKPPRTPWRIISLFYRRYRSKRPDFTVESTGYPTSFLEAGLATDKSDIATAKEPSVGLLSGYKEGRERQIRWFVGHGFNACESIFRCAEFRTARSDKTRVFRRFPGNLAQIGVRGKAGSFIWGRFRQRCAARHRDNLARRFRQVRQVQLVALGPNHECDNRTSRVGRALARFGESNNFVVWHASHVTSSNALFLKFRGSGFAANPGHTSRKAASGLTEAADTSGRCEASTG